MKLTEEQEQAIQELADSGDGYGPYACGYKEGIEEGAEWAIEKFGGIQWNKYPETKPNPNTHCLVITPTHFPKNCYAVVAEWYEEDGPFYDESTETALEDVTHWAYINLPNKEG